MCTRYSINLVIDRTERTAAGAENVEVLPSTIPKDATRLLLKTFGTIQM